MYNYVSYVYSKKKMVRNATEEKRGFCYFVNNASHTFFYLQLSDFKCSCYKAIELLFIIL